MQNIEKNKEELEKFLKKYKNIEFSYNKYNKKEINGIDIKLDYKLGERICSLIPKGICFQCSGITKKKKPYFKIYNNLLNLRKHCDNYHKGELSKCIINYEKPEGFIEVESAKGKEIILMKTNDLCPSDQNYFREKFERDQKEGTEGYFKKEKDDFTICGANIRTMDMFNREAMEYYLIEHNVDIMLLNENYMGKSKKKFQGYKSIMKEKSGIIYKEELNCQQIMREDEDEFNIILKFESEKNGLIVITYYAAPGEGHTNRIKIKKF